MQLSNENWQELMLADPYARNMHAINNLGPRATMLPTLIHTRQLPSPIHFVRSSKALIETNATRTPVLLKYYLHWLEYISIVMQPSACSKCREDADEHQASWVAGNDN